MYAGDSRYKTNFFLKFIDPNIRSLYDKSLLPLSYYSIRIFIIMICIVDIFMLDKSVATHSFFSRLFVVSLTLLSLYATTKPGRQLSLYL
jgi:hypothetical protein